MAEKGKVMAPMGSKSVKNNFGRALDMISRLQARQRMTPRKVSQLYDVSMRQAYRIMNEAMLCLPLTKDVVNGEAVYRWIN